MEIHDLDQPRHHRTRRAAPASRDPDDGLRLLPGPVRGRGEVPDLPDLHLRLPLGFRGQALLRAGLRAARAGPARIARSHLLQAQQPEPRDPRGAPRDLGRRGARARLLERHGRHLDLPVRALPPGRRGGAQLAGLWRLGLPAREGAARLRHQDRRLPGRHRTGAAAPRGRDRTRAGPGGGDLRRDAGEPDERARGPRRLRSARRRARCAAGSPATRHRRQHVPGAARHRWR